MTKQSARIPGIGIIPDPDKPVRETPYKDKSTKSLQYDLRRYDYIRLTPRMQAEVDKIKAELDSRAV